MSSKEFMRNNNCCIVYIYRYSIYTVQQLLLPQLTESWIMCPSLESTVRDHIFSIYIQFSNYHSWLKVGSCAHLWIALIWIIIFFSSLPPCHVLFSFAPLRRELLFLIWTTKFILLGTFLVRHFYIDHK